MFFVLVVGLVVVVVNHVDVIADFFIVVVVMITMSLLLLTMSLLLLMMLLLTLMLSWFSFLEVSAGSVTLHLNAWQDGGCPIIYFMVEHKRR